jgi:hypothetical protein
MALTELEIKKVAPFTKKALIQRESAKRLALLGGSEPLLNNVPRRQSEPA